MKTTKLIRLQNKHIIFKEYGHTLQYLVANSNMKKDTVTLVGVTSGHRREFSNHSDWQ